MTDVDVVPPPPEIADVDPSVLFLPEPEPREVRYTIISADDHLLEPPHLFEGRLPRRLQDRAPRVVETDTGHQAWEFDGRRFYEWGDAAVAGRAKELVMRVPFRYELVRPGCYDVHARIRDMDINGVWASLNFPSFVTGFCGRVYSQCRDPELGLATTRAWNDWLYEEWYGPYPDRIIPLGITCLNDPERGAEEIRRNAERGFRSVSLPERPHRIGLPSLFSGHWDPIVEACADTDTVISLHVGSTGLHEPPPDVDQGAWLACITALFGQISMQACVEWLISRYPVRHPNLKIAMSEGGIGWVAMLLDRLENMIDRSPYSTLVGWDDVRPADVLRRNFWFCTLDDPSTLSTRHVIGVENILAEVDYPHGDGTWPDTQLVVADVWGALPIHEIRAICCENAARLYRHPLPDVVLPLDDREVTDG
jgi:predicted TIM-barrel fold metal-dependent hydrolase